MTREEIRTERSENLSVEAREGIDRSRWSEERVLSSEFDVDESTSVYVGSNLWRRF